MCETCGCGLGGMERGGHTHDHPVGLHHADESGCVVVGGPEGVRVEVLRAILAENDQVAAHNREHLAQRGVTAINLMSSPGAGKTALLEATITALAGRRRVAVVVGDLETDNDAQRIRRHGVEAVQIVTGSACHLDASMVHEALHHLELDGVDLLFVENVGNLVCPAAYDLGQQRNVVLLAVTEGDDKPAKYPVIFRAADLMGLTKVDLLPHLPEFDPVRAEAALRRLANPVPVLPLSARSGAGMTEWLAWLESALQEGRR